MPTLKGTKASLSYLECFLYYLQYLFFILHGWIPSGQTICTTHTHTHGIIFLFGPKYLPNTSVECDILGRGC